MNNRFLVNFNFALEFLDIDDKEICHQIKNVLRLKKGDKIILIDGKLNEAEAIIQDIKRDSLKVKIVKKMINKNELPVCPVLYCSILKKENFEIVVEKGTEIGIKEFVPLISKRTVKLNFRRKRLEKIIKEAVEQSQRGFFPILKDPVNFKEAIYQANNNYMNFFFDKSGKRFIVENIKIKNDSKIGIWIGPEGGWDESEIKIAKENNFEVITLGRLILRAETAAIVASYLVSHLKDMTS